MNRQLMFRRDRPLVLPWCCRWLAWLLVLAVLGSSIFFIWAYALQFGAEKTSRWLTSFVVTFLTSLLVVEPLTVIAGSLVESTCRSESSSRRADVDDVDFDEEDPHLHSDESWQHLEPLDANYQRKVHAVAGNRDTSFVEELRQKLVKEREMALVLRDIVTYLLFLIMLGFLTYGNKDPSAFLMVTNFRNAFIKEGNLYWDYKNKVKTSDDYWRWLKTIMLGELRAQRWYNDDPPYGLRGFLDDRENRIIGYAILRQVRNDRRKCRRPKAMKKFTKTCSGGRSVDLEDRSHYCAKWVTFPAFQGACDLPEFRYSTAEELEAFQTYGRLGSYSGGGYVMPLRGPASRLLERLDYLQRQDWIDGSTRAVILEFSVYNANVNLFGIATVMAEFHPGGGLRPYWRFDSIRLINPLTGFGYFLLLNEVGFVLVTVFFTVRESWHCYKRGPSHYFTNYWSLAETAIILTSYAAIALYVLRYLEVSRMLKIFKETYGNGYVRLEYAALLDQFFLYSVSGIVFFSTIKFIKLLQFNKRMNILGNTLSRCWDELRVFFFTFGVIFFAFSTLFFTIFNLQLEDFSNILATLQMSFSMMLGKFDFEAMARTSYLSPLLFFVFSLSTSMVLINLMLSIIIRTFNKVKYDLMTQPNKYDIVDYVMQKTLVSLGVRKEEKRDCTIQPDVQSPTTVDSNDEFPDKVNVLLAYINEIYFGGQMDRYNPSGFKARIAQKSTLEQYRLDPMRSGTNGRIGKEETAHSALDSSRNSFNPDSNTNTASSPLVKPRK